MKNIWIGTRQLGILVERIEVLGVFRPTGEDPVTHSLIGADRNTHLKIVVISLTAAILLVGVGISARVADSATEQLQATGPVLKAGKPAMWTGADAAAIR